MNDPGIVGPRPLAAVSDRRILLVDHPETDQAVLLAALEREGFSATAAHGRTVSPASAAVGPFDIVILALTATDAVGLARLADQRARGPQAHILVVSGPAGEAGVADRVRSLRSGADDHLSCPYSLPELVARVAAAARRLGAGEAARSAGHEPEIVRFGDATIDLSARTVTSGDGPVALTRREFELLAYLVRHPGRSFSREQLLKAVWSSSAEWQSETTVTEHVRRLRAKLETDPRHPRWIATVQGVGYRFERRDAFDPLGL